MQRQNAILEALTKTFQPSHLEVINESHQHNVPPGSESHFKVIIVSQTFDQTMLIKRHRAVNNALAFAFEDGLHALSIHAFDPKEWSIKNGAVADSPNCLGGSKKAP